MLPDDEYRKLQIIVANRPETGTIIKGSGGLRKIRWSLPSRGKRGGVRVIYYWVVAQDRILMLLMYPKSERDDLTPTQLRLLKKIVEEEYP